MVREIADTSGGQSLNSTVHGGEAATQRGSGSGRSGSLGNGKGERRSIGNAGGSSEKKEMVLKVTSILSRHQRDIAEKEAKLLSRLSHPSIIKMFDTCYRTVSHAGNSKKDPKKDRPQHLILMEYCDGGHALDVCTNMVSNGTRFDLSTLIIAFGQICNAVSYLHAQRPPIVHRDLKPANFLVKNGAYKLCDFGSAVFGHVDLKTPEARREAEEVIEKTTTQMFRAPEMVDLYMAKKLTQATDVWALGCCLFSLAFLQNCFEEGSNLAILSGKYKIPEDNPYGEGLVELLDRMLTLDCKARADMTEVILCLSAVYSGRPLPPRKDRTKKKEGDKEKDKDRKERSGDKEKTSSSSSRRKKDDKGDSATGTFRTNAQGVYGEDLALDPELAKKAPAEKRKVDPNSALARRLAAAGKVESAAPGASGEDKVDDFAAFPSSAADFSVDFENTAAFGEFEAKDTDDDDGAGAFGAFDASTEKGVDIDEAFGVPAGGGSDWGEGSESNGNKFDAFSTFSPDGVELTEGNVEDLAGDDNEEGGGTEESGHRRRRKSSKTKSSSTDSGEAGEGGEGDKSRRGHLRRTRSGARRSKGDVTKTGDESDELGAMADSQGDAAEDSKHRRSSRPSSRTVRKDGVRRSTSNPDEVKDAADKMRKDKESKHSSSRHSSSRKSTKSKDEGDKPDP